VQEIRVRSLGQEESLGKEMATHSRALFFFFFKFLAVLGLCPGLSLVVVHVPLIMVASLCCRAWALGVQAQDLWCTGIWCLPGPGVEPMSPALASGFLTTGPPGKPTPVFLPGKKSHGQRSLTGYTIHGVTKELDTT